MIYELRTYQLKMAGVPEFLETLKTELLLCSRHRRP